jgi:hypothetical protein
MYRVETDVDVSDFLIDAATRDAIGVQRTPREQLLVSEHDGEVSLALFVDAKVLANLEQNDPRRRLDEDNLQDFLYTVEGVSHFVYFVWRARRGRPVSALELELQAEIDKYLVVRLFAPVSGDLIPQLFEQIRFSDRLSELERERYVVANRAGRRYARWLDHQIARGRAAFAIDDARQLYRKPLAAKLDHIARAA